MPVTSGFVQHLIFAGHGQSISGIAALVDSVAMTPTGITSGSYANPTLTVDGAGRITVIAGGISGNTPTNLTVGTTTIASGASGQLLSDLGGTLFEVPAYSAGSGLTLLSGNVFALTSGGINLIVGATYLASGTSGFLLSQSSGTLQQVPPYSAGSGLTLLSGNTFYVNTNLTLVIGGMSVASGFSGYLLTQSSGGLQEVPPYQPGSGLSLLSGNFFMLNSGVGSTSVVLGTTPVTSGASGNILFDTSGVISEMPPYKAGSGLTLLSGNTFLINSGLGSITLGSTSLTSGTSGFLLADRSGVVGEVPPYSAGSGLTLLSGNVFLLNSGAGGGGGGTGGAIVNTFAVTNANSGFYTIVSGPPNQLYNLTTTGSGAPSLITYYLPPPVSGWYGNITNNNTSGTPIEIVPPSGFFYSFDGVSGALVIINPQQGMQVYSDGSGYWSQRGWEGNQSFSLSFANSGTNSGSFSWNALTTQIASVSISGSQSYLLKFPTGLIAGRSYFLYSTNVSASGNLTYGAGFHWPSGVAPNLTNISGALDIISFHCFDSADLFGVMQRNFI